MQNLKILSIVIIIIFIELMLFGCNNSAGSTGSLTDDFLVYTDGEGQPIVVEENAPASSIAGYIKDIETLQPIAGAQIKIDGFLTAYTDVNGYYKVKSIYVDSSTSTTSTPSLSANIVIKAASYNDISDSLTVPQGTTVDASFMMTRQKGTISGLVIENSSSVANAEIKLGSDQATSNVNGYYTFSDISTGTKNMKVMVNGVVRLSTLVDIKEGFQNLNINLDDQQGSITTFAKIEGTITDVKTGALLPGIIVNVSGYPAVVSGSEDSGDGTGNSIKGFYTLNNIPTGQRTVTFIDPSGNYYDYTKTIDLSEGENVEDITMTPKPYTTNETSNFAGIVKGPNEELVKDIVIRLRLFDSDLNVYNTYESTSEVDGWFNFIDIPQGDYILTAQDSRNPVSYSDYYKEDVSIDDGTLYMSIQMETASGANP